MQYPQEKKEKITQRMLPPENACITQLAQEVGVNASTLHAWKKEALIRANLETKSVKSSGDRGSREKFLIVLETYTMNEAELSDYCRKKGLYKEEIERWRETCLNANSSLPANPQQLMNDLRTEKKLTKSLAYELRRKEKALAEAAALLVLRKKAQAIWGDPEDE